MLMSSAFVCDCVQVFVFVSRTIKYSVEDLVSADAAVIARTATQLAIKIFFIFSSVLIADHLCAADYGQ